MEREIEGFQVEVEHGCYARRERSRGQCGIEVEFNGESLIVEGEEGNWYERQQVSCHVPMSVLVELLRARGWSVEPPQR